MNKITFKVAAVFSAASMMAACSHVTVEKPFGKLTKHDPISVGTRILTGNAGKTKAQQNDLAEKQVALLDTYFSAYKDKDQEALLSLFSEDILGAMHPGTVFGVGIDAARPGIVDDFESRPNSYVKVSQRYRIAKDKWVAFGKSVNGDETAPIWMLFDLDSAGEKIEATYSQIGWSGFNPGPSVDAPTATMSAAYEEIAAKLAGDDFADAAVHFADDVSLFVYPPRDINDQQAVISGAGDVISVLKFKWGEGAWNTENSTSAYMQFVFVGIRGSGDEKFPLDRVALFTFGADPDSPSYEKIVLVDIMGPSGG